MSDSELSKRMVSSGADGAGTPELIRGIPHCLALGMEILDSGNGKARLRLPYRADLVGDTETGVLSGGAITTLLDTCCGTAVLSAESDVRSTATLDLRIDYMRPAMPGEAVIAEAECYRITRSVAFVRASASHEDREKPIAAAAAAFVIELARESER